MIFHDRSKWRDWRKQRERKEQKAEPVPQAPPAAITYPYIWYPPEPIPPRLRGRPKLTETEKTKRAAASAKARAKDKRQREEQKVKLLLQRFDRKNQHKEARLLKQAEAERERAEKQLRREQRKQQALLEQRLRDVEKKPRKAAVIPFEGPVMTPDDLGDLGSESPSDLYLDAEQLRTLAEIEDDGFIHEDEEELDAILREELKVTFKRGWFRHDFVRARKHRREKLSNYINAVAKRHTQ